MITEGELDAIEKRVNDAQVGPWRTDTMKNVGENWLVATFGADSDGDWIVTTDRLAASRTNGATAKDDATFVAHAREDVPRLCAELRRAICRIEALAAENEMLRQRGLFA